MPTYIQMLPQIHKILIKPHTHKNHTYYVPSNSHIHIFYIQIEHAYNTTHNIITTPQTRHICIHSKLHMDHQTSHAGHTYTQHYYTHTQKKPHISYIPRTYHTEHTHHTHCLPPYLCIIMCTIHTTFIPHKHIP